MKNLKMVTLFIVSVISITDILAQSSSSLRDITFKTTINSDAGIHTGYLKQLNDTSLIISSIPLKFNTFSSYENPEKEKRFLYNNINSVKMQRKGAGKRGALIGGLSGMLAGIAIGLIQGDDPHIPPSEDFLGIGEAFRMTAGDKALLGGLTGFGAGGLAGFIIGSLAQKKYIIGGKKKTFTDMKQVILNKAYTYSMTQNNPAVGY